MIPVLGIPYVNRPELLLRCVRSIDVEVGALVIVDQMVEPLNEEHWAAIQDADIPYRQLLACRHPNLGCAGAWNEIIRLCAAPWWLLVNNDIQFTPGDLAAMEEFIASDRDRVDTRPLSAAYGNHGASWWAVTAHGIRTVGLFDENLWPAYLEDCDWSYRCDRLRQRRENVPVATHAIHGTPEQPGSCTANANAGLRNFISRCHGEGFKYYRAKWGGVNEKETYDHPFNDPAWPVWAWKFDPMWRAHLMSQAR